MLSLSIGIHVETLRLTANSDEVACMRLLAAGLHGIQGSQLQMLKIHLAMQASQHWYLVIELLFLCGAIKKHHLQEFTTLQKLRSWMEADWQSQSPSKLFQAFTTTNSTTMTSRLDTLHKAHPAQQPSKCLARRNRSLKHQQPSPTPAQLVPASSKSAHISRHQIHLPTLHLILCACF
jgi:hypothetical protein